MQCGVRCHVTPGRTAIQYRRIEPITSVVTMNILKYRDLITVNLHQRNARYCPSSIPGSVSLFLSLGVEFCRFCRFCISGKTLSVRALARSLALRASVCPSFSRRVRTAAPL
jgi:hypothetical protein